MPPQDTPDPSTTPFTAAVLDLRAQGSSEDGNVVVELDGTGRMQSVSIASVAMESSHSTLEASVLDAAHAAQDALDALRAERSAELLSSARERVGDLTTEIRAISEQAGQRLASTLQTVQQLSDRIAGAS